MLANFTCLSNMVVLLIDVIFLDNSYGDYNQVLLLRGLNQVSKMDYHRFLLDTGANILISLRLKVV